jgi:uncharacterized protein YndB with AHSA1/START domain
LADRLALEMTHVLPATPAAVFAAFADPQQLREWWGPKGFQVRDLDFDPRPGKSYRIEMQPPEGDAFNLTGEFLEVEPPSRLAFTFIYEDPDPDDVDTEVNLSFRERDGSTEVGFRQGEFKTPARRSLHHDGWSDSFERLSRFLSERS